MRVGESFTRGAFDSRKSHRGRSVPMADRLAGDLDRHFQRSHYRGDHDLVFAHTTTGRVLDASKLRKRFRAALARAGVQDVTFHELRRTFGTPNARRPPMRPSGGGFAGDPRPPRAGASGRARDR